MNPYEPQIDWKHPLTPQSPRTTEGEDWFFPLAFLVLMAGLIGIPLAFLWWLVSMLF